MAPYHDEIAGYVRDGLDAKEIWAKLRQEHPHAALHLPDVRQVQNYVRPLRPLVSVHSWSLAAADDAELPLIPQVLAAAAAGAWWGRAEGIGPPQARNARKLLQAAPDLAPAWVWWLSWKYTTRQARNEPTWTLDLLVGFGPWRSPQHFEAFRRFVLDHHPEWITAREGTIADACRMEAERREEPFDARTTFQELYDRYFREEEQHD